jgi:serine/threonine protein kinase/tetratricopeptide (TPR) repeat protein
MTSERWERLASLFDEARAVPQEQRSAFLDVACAGDDSMRAEVERLLAAHDRAGDFIASPAIARITGSTSGDNDPAVVGQTFGPYRVLREIARGGMGAVYLAERVDGEFERRVALKLIKRGMDTDLVLQRFRAERQILATLEHPNIARLLDGGSTDDGRPYFIMEYIEGQPIDEYADANRLSIRERLALFLEVCSAVEYAHRHLVVHRDIKPANVLVTTDGVPKLLDFGIAKVLDSNDDQSTGTITAVRLLTPEYASPEQVEGRRATVTSDVYSLGVVLYRLLTGQSPYRLDSHDPMTVADAVRTHDPERPSTAVSQTTSTIDRRVRHLDEDRARATNAGSIARLRQELRGDLDTIVLMALRKEPDRRYRSVADFADDLGRHLGGQPVRARRDRLGYRAAKFLRRNRTPVLASTIAVATLVLGVGIAAWRWPLESRSGLVSSRDRILVADFVDHSGDTALAAAVTEALRVDLTQSAYVQLLSARQIRSGLGRMARGPDVALDDSLARELAVREGVKAFVTGTVSRVGGRYTVAAQIIGAEKGELLAGLRQTASDSNGVIPAIGRLSAELRARLGESLRNIRATPPLDQVTTTSLAALRLYTMGNRVSRAGNRDSAVKLFRRAVAIDTGFAAAYRALGNEYSDAAEPGRALAAFAGAIAHAQRLPFYERYQTIASHASNYLHDYPLAISAFEHILERYPDDIVALNNLSYVYGNERKFVQEESLLVRAIRIDSTIKSIHLTLAMSALDNGDYDLARRQIGWVATRDPKLPNVLLAKIYLPASQQDWETAERMSRARLAAAANDTFDLPDAYETLAGIVMTRGRLSEGERLSRTAMSIAQHIRSSRVMTSAIRIALVQLRFRNDTSAALAELERALSAYPLDSIPEGDRHYDDFARVFAAAGHPARARQLVSLAARGQLDRVQKSNPDRHWSLGAIALAEGRVRDAVAELRTADATHLCTICVLPDLARAYMAAGQADSAIAVYERYLVLPWEWRFETDDTEMAPALINVAAMYRQRGDAVRADATVARLDTLWRDADPNARRWLATATQQRPRD